MILHKLSAHVENSMQWTWELCNHTYAFANKWTLFRCIGQIHSDCVKQILMDAWHASHRPFATVHCIGFSNRCLSCTEDNCLWDASHARIMQKAWCGNHHMTMAWQGRPVNFLSKFEGYQVIPFSLYRMLMTESLLGTISWHQKVILKWTHFRGANIICLFIFWCLKVEWSLWNLRLTNRIFFGCFLLWDIIMYFWPYSMNPWIMFAQQNYVRWLHIPEVHVSLFD